jgi:hypothetical protein
VTTANRLPVGEVRRILDEMDGVQWKQAEHLARVTARGVVGMEGEDLLLEACTVLLEGKRRYPPGEHPLVVLKTLMRSLASNARKSAWAKGLNPNVSVEPEPSEDDQEELGTRALADGAIDRVTPENEILDKEHLDAVLALHGGDAEEEAVLVAWALGMRGTEAMEMVGLDAKTYDAVRNRLRRKLAPFMPKGRKS